MKRLAKTNILILDDFEMGPIAWSDGREIPEMIEDRYNVSSTIVRDEYAPDEWYAKTGDQTIAVRSA